MKKLQTSDSVLEKDVQGVLGEEKEAPNQPLRNLEKNSNFCCFFYLWKRKLFWYLVFNTNIIYSEVTLSVGRSVTKAKPLIFVAWVMIDYSFAINDKHVIKNLFKINISSGEVLKARDKENRNYKFLRQTVSESR